MALLVDTISRSVHLARTRHPRGRRHHGPRGDGLEGERGSAVSDLMSRGLSEDEAMAMIGAACRADREGMLPSWSTPLKLTAAHRATDGRGRWLNGASEATGRNQVAVDNVAVAGEARTPAANKGEVFTSFDVKAFEVPSGRDEVWPGSPRCAGAARAAQRHRRRRRQRDRRRSSGGRYSVETVGRDDARLGEAGAPGRPGCRASVFVVRNRDSAERRQRGRGARRLLPAAAADLYLCAGRIGRGGGGSTGSPSTGGV